jgi:hypothetical protein
MTIEPDILGGLTLLAALAILSAYRLGYVRGRRRGTYDILEARAAAARARPLRAPERRTHRPG